VTKTKTKIKTADEKNTGKYSIGSHCSTSFMITQ